jgi:hypothetical protein
VHLNPSNTTELLDLYLDRSVPENRTVDILIGPSETSVFLHKLIVFHRLGRRRLDPV